MFNLKKREKETKVIVKTKQELNAAVKRKEPCIEVQGPLVTKIKWMKKLSATKIMALAALLASAVIPSPIAPISMCAFASGSAATAVSAITGTEIAAIILAGGLSATMILGVLKNYNMEIKGGDKIIVLTKK